MWRKRNVQLRELKLEIGRIGRDRQQERKSVIFYHFTSREALESIVAEGLNQGEAPMSHYRVAKAVNLTTDRNPHGHGLDMGGHVVTEAESALFTRKGFDIPAGTIFVEKRAVRITVKLPSNDPNLKSWRSWSRKHCEEGYAEHLEQTAGMQGRKAKTWWLYFGTVPPSAFTAVDILIAGEGEAA